MSIAYGTRQPCDRGLAAATRPIFCPRRDKPWVLATAILGSSLAFIEGSVVNLALPAVQADFGSTSTDLQWVINAYLLVLGSFMLVGGSLGDRYGLRRVFISGTAIFGFAALAAALAPSLPVLVAARLLQGAGGALLVPTSLALIGSHFEEHERGRAIGTWAGASALTTAIGPVLGGWLVDQWGWPAVFLLVAPLAAITVAIGWWRVPVSRARNREPLDYPGGGLLAAALGLMIYALVVDAGWFMRFALLTVAVLLGAAFLRRERRFDFPMLPLRLFRSPAFSGANAMTLLLYSALAGALYFLPFNLIQVQGYSATAAGAAFLPFSLILGFGSAFAGDLIRKGNPRKILTAGPLITAAGFVALAVPGHGASYFAGFFPGIVLIGIGMTLSVAPLTTVVMNSVGTDEAGLASGVNNTAARIAGVLAIGALTALAVASFKEALGAGMRINEVPPALAERLSAAASQLAKLEAPPGTTEATAAAVADAVAAAYVFTFRVLVTVCGLLAALSGAIAWFSLDRSAGRASAAVKEPAAGA